jgi:hypothetical protein
MNTKRTAWSFQELCGERRDWSNYDLQKLMAHKVATSRVWYSFEHFIACDWAINIPWSLKLFPNLVPPSTFCLVLPMCGYGYRRFRFIRENTKPWFSANPRNMYSVFNITVYKPSRMKCLDRMSSFCLK